MNVVALRNKRSVGQWVAAITGAYQGSIEHIVETGKLLAEAKDELDHGDWLPMVKDQLPFSQRTANRLMAIASHPVLSNKTHASNLPASWMTLYELTKLSEPELRSKIKDGTINPKMRRKDATALLPTKKQRAPATREPSKSRSITLDSARDAYSAAAKILTKQERKDEIFKLMDLFGLSLSADFIEMMTFGGKL